ncbi:MAG TPA: CHAT domain-containing protein, partial [Thermoanaerobaculia bacterium]
RAMIIDRLGLDALARSAYDAYLRADATSAWSSEARERVASLEALRSRATLWECLRLTLFRAAAAGDLGHVATTARNYPEYARRWAESECLAEWAHAMSRGDHVGAAAHLTVSRVIGETLKLTKGETLLAASVAAIDQASNNPAKLAVLVTAHQLYFDASRLNGLRQTVAASGKFKKAQSLFEQGASPMALMARYFSASAAVDIGDHTRALAMLDALTAEMSPDFYGLHAQMNRLRATILSFNGRFEAALSSQRAAHRAFLAIGEVPSAVEMTGRMATTLMSLGRSHEAWPMIRSALTAAGKHGDVRMIQSVLHAAAFIALNERRWELARALLNLELEGGGVDTRLAEAAIWRALAAERAGLTGAIATELARARDAAASIADPNFREGAENEVRLTEALLTGNRSPHRTRTLLTEYLSVAEKRGRRRRVPEVLVLRAAASRQLEYLDEAENDLRLAVQMIEKRRERIEHDILRDAFLGKSSDAYTALAELLDSRGEYAAALSAADQPRARILLDRKRASTSSEYIPALRIADRLPPRTALIAFGFFTERTVRYVITRRGLERIATANPSREIERSIEQFFNAIGTGDNARATREGRWLHSALIAPAHAAIAGYNHLIIVDDPLFSRLPFAALVQPNDRFLVEDVIITITPSIQALETSSPRRQHDPRAQNLLSVGNPSINSARDSTLPSLAAAEREAKEVAALYDHVTLLVSHDATKGRIIEALRRVDIAHLATHAVSDPFNPESSRLLVASAEIRDDSLTTAEIAAMDLHGLDTVVIAGCQTAIPSHGYGYVRSISSAFLAAVATHVIASLWDIEDSVGREFSVALHRALRGGVDTSKAVRIVQLQMLRSPNPRLKALAAWSAMQLYSVDH